MTHGTMANLSLIITWALCKSFPREKLFDLGSGVSIVQDQGLHINNCEYCFCCQSYMYVARIFKICRTLNVKRTRCNQVELGYSNHTFKNVCNKCL